MNHYERLKVTQDAPPEVIRAAYRALANRLHPDRSGAGHVTDAAHEQMAALNAAYEVLIDPALRRDYDASLSTARNWQAAAADAALDPARDPSVGVVPGDLTAPVTAWAPEMKHVLLAGAGALLLTVVGVSWYLRADQATSPLDVAVSEQLGRQDNTAAIEAARRGEMPALTPADGAGVRRPSVEELARMSDEELVAAMPALDGQAAPMPEPVRAASLGSSRVHPLDGPGLPLKVETGLLGFDVANGRAGGKP